MDIQQQFTSNVIPSSQEEEVTEVAEEGTLGATAGTTMTTSQHRATTLTATATATATATVTSTIMPQSYTLLTSPAMSVTMSREYAG